jgi:hypothetical protein
LLHAHREVISERWTSETCEGHPTPEQIDASRQRIREECALWHHDLYAGSDWNVTTAYDQWVKLALREGWIERDPLA